MLFIIFISSLLMFVFAGAEVAFLSANKLRVELKKKKGSKRGQIIAVFFEREDEFLNTLLVGNVIFLVIFSIACGRLLAPQLAPFFQNEWQHFSCVIAIVGILVLIFGEFLPKTLFRMFAEDALYFLAYPLQWLTNLLAVPARIVFSVGNFLIKTLLRRSVLETKQHFSRLDLEDFIKNTRTDSEEEIDTELFEKALNLREVRVKEIMVPRTEIVHIDLLSKVEELEQLFQETKLSRILVTKDDVDNVVGYVHHQQMFKNPKSIKHILLAIHFVPVVMRVRDAMSLFIKNRWNIACVVDEFGGTAGILTLEDIVEQIFGEIDDEHDQEDDIEVEVSEREFLFSGRLAISYLNEKYALQLPDDSNFNTLSGYLVTTATDIPKQGERFILPPYEFIIESVGNTKIETVRILKTGDGAE